MSEFLTVVHGEADISRGKKVETVSVDTLDCARFKVRLPSPKDAINTSTNKVIVILQ